MVEFMRVKGEKESESSFYLLHGVWILDGNGGLNRSVSKVLSHSHHLQSVCCWLTEQVPLTEWNSGQTQVRMLSSPNV